MPGKLQNPALMKPFYFWNFAKRCDVCVVSCSKLDKFTVPIMQSKSPLCFKAAII